MVNLVEEIIGKNYGAMIIKIDNISSINPNEESDSTQKKQTHQNELPLPERACREWKVEPRALQNIELYWRYKDEGYAGQIVQEIKNNDKCR